MKDKKLLIYSILLVIVIVIFVVLKMITNNYDKLEDGTKFKTEYEALNTSIVMNIDEKNPIKYLTFEEVEELFQSGTGVIYFGFPSCPWCRNIIPVLFDVAKENKFDTIYYLNPRELKNNDFDKYSKLLEILNPYLKEEDGKRVFTVPDVYFIKDGKVVGNHRSTVESQTDPKVSLNENQIKELSGIYKNLFDKLK